MSNPHDPPDVLSAWQRSLTPQYCEFLDNAGGFSGARFWKICSQSGNFCLRRWPEEHPTPERLAWIHTVIAHAAKQGVVPLAVPIRTDKGTTFTRYAGFLWELTLWLPGEPYDFTQRDSPGMGEPLVGEAICEPHRMQQMHRMVSAAVAALAKFHLATDRFQASDIAPYSWGISPAINERWNRIQAVNVTQLTLLRSAILNSSSWPKLAPLALEVLELIPRALPGVFKQVEACFTHEVALQPCLRDIWGDHILFTGEEVTGLIDYGAMRVENVAADFARLMGNISGDNEARWTIGRRAYETARWASFSTAEWQLVEAFDATQVVFSGLNWIEWIFVEHREFPDMKSIERRMQGILARLRRRATE
jgi:Ser/Thr protein kinase RdoA (MazF antagonist)